MPQDAEDATQEILIKVFNHINDFNRESAFVTWVYSIARNHLINECQKQKNRPMLSFDIMMMDSNGHVEFNHNSKDKPIDDALLTAELKVSCTRAMLQCLDEEKRMMFIVSEIMGINSNECALIFEITSTTYRKRLSRINEKMRSFMSEICGLVNDNASCHCGRSKLAKFYKEKSGNLEVAKKAAGATWGVLTALPVLVTLILAVTTYKTERLMLLMVLIIFMILRGLVHQKNCDTCKMRYSCHGSAYKALS